ncbi:hypothetical protein [Emticicia sp. 21SJ11W-3]|uniref:hypothetical protein n=1 Tax=Emticicia sp. 21SJ11W-3 TaxID=2916755 RepID=UPI00209DCC42|nr:hypothetical protein [Emticicia sp. 21SJ11W-3]UTA68619.1 hypothetical protein MB380_02155 [Emticicia sp. 21SJ11W-3]
MKDRLERFVRDNREDFDSYEPSKALWKKIETEVAQQQPKGKPLNGKIVKLGRVQWRMSIAAGIALILTVGYGIITYMQMPNDITGLSLPPAYRSAYGKELVQFTSLVEQKREELKALEKEDPQLYHQFDAELQALDKNYQNLKNELPQNPNPEELLKAMVQNLNMQIDLLNQQLQIIQKIKNMKDGKIKTMV